ncbi:MAG: hypothetical protein ACN6PR_10590 [Achromobacter sp.]
MDKVLAFGPSRGGLAVMVAIVGLLSGCSVSSGLCDTFGPSKRASVAIPQGASADEVFACIDKETLGNAERGSLFDSGYAVRDTKAGVLETEHYGSSNVTGLRFRAEVAQKTSTLDLSLRGAGAYCTDPGVDKEMARLTTDVARCLQR